MATDTVQWVGELDGLVRLIDQTLLPNEFVYMDCHTDDELVDAIKRLCVRGAPAIGVAAAMGLVLGVRNAKPASAEELMAALTVSSRKLAASRPTAVNLFWALDRMGRKARSVQGRPAGEILQALLGEAREIMAEDDRLCRGIGRHGAELVSDGDRILTHCNAGGLATSGYGTALAVMFTAHEQKKSFRVYADETRPLLQGARLTTWELMRAGIDTVLICDDMAGAVMKAGMVNKVIVGADRIAANGDTANKIGTYTLAVLARHHQVPFYIAAPSSTFDLSIADGSEIPIEERAPEEVTEPFGCRIAPEGVAVYSPAFDVTPAALIAGIITEKGVIRRPDADRVAETVGQAQPGPT
jgi:methylthioribose-1-phosphate isomerase